MNGVLVEGVWKLKRFLGMSDDKGYDGGMLWVEGKGDMEESGFDGVEG